MIFLEDRDFAVKLKAFLNLEDGLYRRSGRTTLLARIFVELALESGREIYPFDHHVSSNSMQMKQNILRECEKYWYEKLQEHIPDMQLIVDRHRTFSIKFIQKRPHPVPSYYMKNRLDISEHTMEYALRNALLDTSSSIFPIKELEEQLQRAKEKFIDKTINKNLLLICC